MERRSIALWPLAWVLICACGTTPVRPPPSVSIPDTPTVTQSEREAAQAAWAEFQETHYASLRPRVFDGAEVAAAVAQVGEGDADTLRDVYEARLGAPIFFADGRLTRAGKRALELYEEAWTHGQPRPEGWPSLTDTAAWSRPFELASTTRLSESDAVRAARNGLVPFPVERMSPAALAQLASLEEAARERRRILAVRDGQLVNAMWLLARATRPVDRRPKARRGPWQPDSALWKAPEAALASVVPHHPDYDRLRRAFVRYVEIRDAGGFPELPARIPKLKLGSRHAVIPQIRARLAAEGFVAVADADRPIDVMDDRLVAQIHAFQETRHLKATGAIDKKTLAQLRVSADDLVARLQFGLHRWHLSSGRDLDYYLRVNIPRFQVQVVRENSVTHRYKAVVGTGRTQTPRFQGVVDHIVVHPWWFGVRGEPKQVPPGPKNPLGILVLKIQPRHLLIYLHGTNQPHLFSEPLRAFSHGCVRLEDPTILGGVVLDADPGPESSADLPPILGNGRKTTKIYLAQPVPVFFEYNTTFVAESGDVHFARDMYGDDRYLRRLVTPPHDPVSTWRPEREASLGNGR